MVQLTPVLHEELPAFGITDLRQRLLRGGMPPALLAPEMNVEFYSEWMDSYFARDVQELFHLEKRAAFLRLLAGCSASPGSRPRARSAGPRL